MSVNKTSSDLPNSNKFFDSNQRAAIAVALSIILSVGSFIALTYISALPLNYTKIILFTAAFCGTFSFVGGAAIASAHKSQSK